MPNQHRPGYFKDRSRFRKAALKAVGGATRSFELQPATVAALRELRARGAVSDAAAVNAAVVFMAEHGKLPSWVKAHEEATR